MKRDFEDYVAVGVLALMGLSVAFLFVATAISLLRGG